MHVALQAASLLGCDVDELSQSLCFKDSTFGIGETITIPLDPGKARDQCDAFAKYLYGSLFDYIVFLVNNILYRGRVAKNIGVLDIFGFEVFKQNSFEQLCINYCNERLQTFFNECIFENEKKVYEIEDIDTSNITFQDNIGCLHLIDKKATGIFSILDEVGAFLLLLFCNKCMRMWRSTTNCFWLCCVTLWCCVCCGRYRYVVCRRA